MSIILTGPTPVIFGSSSQSVVVQSLSVTLSGLMLVVYGANGSSQSKNATVQLNAAQLSGMANLAGAAVQAAEGWPTPPIITTG